jgi:ABC-type sugar transport system substrate-binding protein
VAHEAPGYDAAGAAAADTKTALLKYPNLNVILEDDDSSAAGVAQALKELNKTNTVDLIGIGGNAAAVARVKAGTEFGSVINTPQTDAKAAMQMLIEAIHGEKVPQSELDTYTISPLGKDFGTVSKDNVDKFTAQW